MRGYVRTRSGEPRPGVLVSDGRTVTTTAQDGSWSLDPARPFVFVTRPAGYTCADWFVRPAAGCDFVLDPVPGVFPHRFVHVSDTHLGAGPRYASMYPQPVQIGTGDVLTRFLTRLPQLVPDVASVVATGDLTDLGLDEEYAALRAARDASPVALHLLPGNHDHMNGVVTGAVSRNGYALHTADPAGYERNIGPRWYSYDLPGLHVVALDWHTHEMGIDHEAQDTWIRADLESVPAGTADPIGPEPVAAAPDLRTAWHEALAALGPVDGPDVRGMTDGRRLHLRDTYPIETAWAPQYVGDELRQVRAAAREAAARAHAWLARAGYLVAVPGVGMVVTPANRWPKAN